jgi:ABC-type transport system involved in multi-copper enzyme maturation permease subunit
MYIALGVWFVFMGFITWLINQFFYAALYLEAEGVSGWLFSLITLFVMGMSLLVAPVFSASAIVSDREHGVLATLQATKLSAVEIAAGKLLASWLVSLAFVVVTIPYVGYAVWLGGVSLQQVAVATAVVFIEVALICTIGLGWSAITSRAVISTVFTYLSVAFMTVITLIIFATATAMTVSDEQVSDWELPLSAERSYVADLNAWFASSSNSAAPPAPPWEQCAWVERGYSSSIAHTEYTWWLLLVNPFVIVADAAASPTVPLQDSVLDSTDPLALIKLGVRSARIGDAAGADNCGASTTWLGDYRIAPRSDGTFTITSPDGIAVISAPGTKPTSPFAGYDIDDPVWPWGMASNAIIAAAFFYLAVRRLSVPYGVLPSGQRVA